MSHLKLTNGTTISWPSLGLIRTWAVMLILSADPGPSFVECWIGVTLVRIAWAILGGKRTWTESPRR